MTITHRETPLRGMAHWAEASAVAFITAQMKFHYFSCPAHNRTLVPRRWHWVVKHRV